MKDFTMKNKDFQNIIMCLEQNNEHDLAKEIIKSRKKRKKKYKMERRCSNQQAKKVGFGDCQKNAPIAPAVSEDVNNSELKMGIKVENEHRDVYDYFKKYLKDHCKMDMPITEDEFYALIAKAHLRELKDYYTKLNAMEAASK